MGNRVWGGVGVLQRDRVLGEGWSTAANRVLGRVGAMLGDTVRGVVGELNRTDPRPLPPAP